MLIQELILKGFTRHASTHLKFPAKGVVVVTGDNGAGKSSIAEGPCVGFFGETLRGTSPWTGDGQVTVVSDLATATREKKGSRTKLTWNLPGQPPIDYETTTKGQEALEHIVGSFDLYRRSSVFSSQDAAHFTLATDSERKRLLESLLGLDKFDAALEACKAEYQASAGDEQRALNTSRDAAASLATLLARLSDAKTALAAMTPAGDEAQLRAKAAKMQRFADDVKKELDEVQELLRSVDRGDGKREAELEALTRRMSRIKGKDECGECGQPISQLLRQVLKGQVEEQAAAAAKEREHMKGEVGAFEDQLEALKKDQLRLQKEATEAKIALAAIDSMKKQMGHQSAVIDQLTPKAEAAKKAADAAAVLVASSKVIVDELEACVKVLGLKGVRAHVLGKSLGGLEIVANAWLGKIAGSGMSLSLKPYTEKKTGGSTEAISLEVNGAGGGHGYKAASGGERRRIDVSLLLALAEVAQAAHGTSKGTLFLDECMDSLDGDGIERVSDVLNQLAQDRAVVVITHNPQLASKLMPVQRWTVDAGVVQVV